MLTGKRHPNPGERRDPGPDDFPHLGAVTARYRPPKHAAPPFVALPEAANARNPRSAAWKPGGRTPERLAAPRPRTIMHNPG